jgi:hypothetical protein
MNVAGGKNGLWVGYCCDMGAFGNRRLSALWVLEIVVKIERMVVLSLALQS